MLPGGANGKESACQCRRHKKRGFDTWVGKIPWRRTWQSTPALLPEESHGQRSLMGYSPRSHRESDTTEAIQHIHTHDMLRLRNFLTHSGLQFLHFNLFMDVPCGLQDLSFLTRDRTCILGNESVES